MGAGGQKQVLAAGSGCWWTEAGVGGRDQKMRAEARLIWKPLPDSSLVQVIPCSCETEHQIPL